MHESIHQLVYAFGSGRNAHRHRKIGQLLQRRSPEWSENLILKAIDHLNLASSVLTEDDVRQLVEHNLQAGKKALAEGRYAKGKEYAENGLRLSAELRRGNSMFNFSWYWHGRSTWSVIPNRQELAWWN